MSSTEPQNTKALEKEGEKINKPASKLGCVKLKAVACGLLAVAVGITGTFCLSSSLNSTKVTNRSLVSAMSGNVINPEYMDKITKAYTETAPPTDPPTEKATEKPTEKKNDKAKKDVKEKDSKKKSDESKSKEKATEKKTEPETETETEALTDPAVTEEYIYEQTIPENTQNVQIGASVNGSAPSGSVPSESTSEDETIAPTEPVIVTEPVTDPPLTEEQIAQRDQLYQSQWDNGYIMAIDNPDYNYKPQPIKLSDKDRDLAYRIVMGEMGSEGFIGTALVAQAIRDTMNLEGYTSIQQVIKNYGYVGSTSIAPNQASIDAVNFIFDQNGSAVQHRILFFYATWITSNWHESQNFICQYSCVRFFDRWF